jgi:hypothetical protein
VSDPFDDAMSALGGNAGTASAPPAAAAPTASQPTAQGTVDYSPLIEQAARAHNVDPNLIRAVMATEDASGNPAAKSNKGATGLMQINPSNYKALGITNPNDPAQNINGNVPTALTHYVGGDDPSQWGPQTQAYPQKVLANYQRVAQSPQPQPQASAPAAPQADAFDSAMSALQKAPTAAPAQPAGPGMPTAPMNPVTAAQNNSSWSDAAEKGVGNLAGSLIGIAGASARLVGANDFADKAQAARAQIEQQMAADTNNSVAGKVAGVVGSALPYATLGGASIPGAMTGGAVAGAIPAIADNRSAAEAAQGAAVGSAFGAGGALAGKAFRALVPAMSHLFGVGAPAAESTAAAASPAVAGRASIGAAGTSFAQQAAAEGVPDALVQKIAAAEQSGALNPVAASRHIEAGSLPVPVELTAGQASGDVNLLSNELNSRAKNPELAGRFNAQNGQLSDNLTAIRDQVSPNVNVPSGPPTGQALVDAYKEMDEPIRQQIADQYALARNADGTSALVDASGAMRNFESQIGPTRFQALPSRVQQIFADAKNNAITLPAQFDQGGGAARPMNARDIMDIDQTLSGAIAEAKSPTVQHDIGQLRDSILSAPINPAAGPQAVAAFKTAQASARARFQAMDADPAYKAAANDEVPQGVPSPLADQFVQKYIAGGKTANVQNMMQNLSNDPLNQELVASALMDHIRAQAGIDLRTGTGNISQAGLNKAIQNLGDKTRIVLGPEASQTVEKLGNVARYTQEQPRGSYVNNSNTAVTLMGHAGGLAKSVVERGVNAAVPGAQLGSWGREALASRANTREIAKSLEPGAGLGVPLNSLLRKTKGNP